MFIVVHRTNFTRWINNKEIIEKKIDVQGRKILSEQKLLPLLYEITQHYVDWMET